MGRRAGQSTAPESPVPEPVHAGSVDRPSAADQRIRTRSLKTAGLQPMRNSGARHPVPRSTTIDLGPVVTRSPWAYLPRVGPAEGSKVSISVCQTCPAHTGGMTKSRGFPPSVDEDEEVVVEQQGAVGGAVGFVLPLEVDREGPGDGVGLLFAGDDRPGWGVPPQHARVDTGEKPDTEITDAAQASRSTLTELRGIGHLSAGVDPRPGR